jgi:hypothetical protein
MERKEMIDRIMQFLKAVSDSYATNYKGYGKCFVAFIDFIHAIAVKNFNLFYDQIIKKCKIINNMTSLMLDSDNLLAAKAKSDKLAIMQKTFFLVDFCVSEENIDIYEKECFEILQSIYD